LSASEPLTGSGLNLLQPYQNRLRTLVKRCRGVHLFVINKFRPSPFDELGLLTAN